MIYHFSLILGITERLNELNEKGLIQKGDKVVLSGFGGGMTWATVLLEW